MPKSQKKQRGSKGSGRLAGSFSFVFIPLSDIEKKFADKTTPIKVSRLWAENLGFKGLVTGPAEQLTATHSGAVPDQQPAVTKVNLDD